MINILGYKYIYLFIAGILVLVSFISTGIFGLKQGIDFTGGSLLELKFSGVRPSGEKIQEVLLPIGIGSISLQPTGEHGMILRFRDINEMQHQEMLQFIRASVGTDTVTELRFDAIGPVIGREVRNNSMVALLLALLGIMLYVAWAFRHVSRPMSSWKYGIATLITLIHNVAIPTGVFALLGRFYNVEIDILFITALLTIMGFSVHDTIVVFDRIRERLRTQKAPEPYAMTVNRSMNDTLVRSINTSLTVLFMLIAILFWGGATLYYFIIALMIGIVFGTYSSIFVASSLLVVWHESHT